MQRSNDLIIERTADGSSTLYRPDLNEHYHSVKGALAESRHVYIDMGWREAAERRRTIRVFEVGFGTGLNAALTADAAMNEGVVTDYHSVELYPIPADAATGLGYEHLVGSYTAVNAAPWNDTVSINPSFTLTKLTDDFLTMRLPDAIDVVYFDAFAPEKQPEMWTDNVFMRLYAAMSPGAILTTYCAKGEIRRRLQSVGFRVERLSGPPAGKREILRATRTE